MATADKKIPNTFFLLIFSLKIKKEETEVATTIPILFRGNTTELSTLVSCRDFMRKTMEP